MPRSHRKKEFYSRQTIRSIGSSNETNNATITVQYMKQKTQRKHGINNRKCGKSVKIWVNKTASTIQNRLCSCSKCTEMRLKEASNFKSCPGEAPRTPSHTYPAHAATRPSQVSYYTYWRLLQYFLLPLQNFWRTLLPSTAFGDKPRSNQIE